MSDTAELVEQLRAALKGDIKEAVSAEMQRLRDAQPLGKVHRPQQTRRTVNSGVKMFNPKSGHVYDQGLVMEMWRPDLIRSCACGEVKYAQTQSFAGEQAIEVASRPVIDTATGGVAQQAWLPAFHDDGSSAIPENLRLDDERRSHIKKCNEGAEKEEAWWADDGEAIKSQMNKDVFAS